jgi:hypothetical protein
MPRNALTLSECSEKYAAQLSQQKYMGLPPTSRRTLDSFTRNTTPLTGQ